MTDSATATLWKDRRIITLIATVIITVVSEGKMVTDNLIITGIVHSTAAVLTVPIIRVVSQWIAEQTIRRVIQTDSLPTGDLKIHRVIRTDNLLIAE